MEQAVIRIITHRGKSEREFLVGSKYTAVPYACIAGGSVVHLASVFPLDFLANMDGDFGWLKSKIDNQNFSGLYGDGWSGSGIRARMLKYER